MAPWIGPLRGWKSLQEDVEIRRHISKRRTELLLEIAFPIQPSATKYVFLYASTSALCRARGNGYQVRNPGYAPLQHSPFSSTALGSPW